MHRRYYISDKKPRSVFEIGRNRNRYSKAKSVVLSRGRGIDETENDHRLAYERDYDADRIVQVRGRDVLEGIYKICNEMRVRDTRNKYGVIGIR